MLILMLAQTLFHSVKGRIFSNEIKYRRVLWGLARGCYLPINLQSQMRTWLGIPEIEIAGYFKKLVEKGFTCFDIGTAYGYYTVALARLARGGKVVAFEPQAMLATQLRETARRNVFLETTIEIIKMRVGAQVSENMTTLDVLARHENLTPNFIKIDVDGPEYEILVGARQVLERIKPRLVVEVHSFDLERECTALLTQHGYVCKIVDQQTIWPELRPGELNRWVIAVHQTDRWAYWLRSKQ